MMGRLSGRSMGRLSGTWASLAAFGLVATGCGAPADPATAAIASALRTRAQPRVLAAQLQRAAGAPVGSSAPPGAHLTYFGGRVVSNIEVVQVLYGAGGYAPQVTSTSSPSMATFYQGVLTSSYVDWLNEYDTTAPAPTPRTEQVIGRGRFRAQVTIAPSPANNGSTIDDTQLQAELSAQIAAGALPPPTHDAAGNTNTYYAVFFPPGKVITQDGFATCTDLCAYHGTIADAGGAGEVYYGVHHDLQPGSGCEVGCGSASTVFDRQTEIASHELVEAITDPEVGLAFAPGPPFAWFDLDLNEEIGDLCTGLAAPVVGGDGVTYNVQKEFSNSANDCVVNTGPPVISSVSVTPPAFEGGTTVTGTALLNRPARAGGAAVALASSNPAVVAVPASVLVPAGSAVATFPVTSAPVAAATAATVTATFPAGTSVTTTVTAVPSPTPTSLVLTPNTVPGGVDVVATVTISHPAPAGGSNVSLASTDSSIAAVPASVKVPPGMTSKTFRIDTRVQSATVTATVSASLNGLTVSALLTVLRPLPIGNAAFDLSLGTPRCATVGMFCDSGGLIDGRSALVGPEANASNTIHGSCADGTLGAYHVDESLDRLRVSAAGPGMLAAGGKARIDATVWTFGGDGDFLDLFFAPDANAPVWTPITTIAAPSLPQPAPLVLSATFTLPATATLHAIRGNWRFRGSAAPCTAGPFDDRDDLVFALGPSPPPPPPPPPPPRGGKN